MNTLRKKSEAAKSERTKAVTSYDVAREAGVSQSAVSRCFTPGASVSARTRSKILKAVNALGYQPNAIARSLITNRSTLVAVIVANAGFNPEFTATLSQALAAQGLNTLLFTLSQESESDAVIEQLAQYRVAGVIAAVSLSVEQIETLERRSTPLIFLNRVNELIGVNSVSCDQSEGESWLVDGLCAAGHKTFAIVSGPVDSPVSTLRVSSAADWLSRAGITAFETEVADFTYNGGREAMRRIMARNVCPDAIICANDMLAIGCMDEARHGFGLTVPGDVSIVGFDGLSIGKWLSYDLTTVRQPARKMIAAAIDMLQARIEDPAQSTEKRVISGELILGSSARLTKT